MAPDSLANIGTSIGEKIIAVRDKWHTKNHPLFTPETFESSITYCCVCVCVCVYLAWSMASG